jgi:DNA-binding NtrC family response regulator
VKEVRPRLLILDIMMPRLGGIDALVQLRKHFPELLVIVVTGTTDDALRGRATALGAGALLSKPLDLDLLGTMIRTLTPVVAACAGRVLVADDEEDMRSVLHDFLEEHGYEPLLAADGLTALRRLIEERPDVVLLDIQMPRLGGMEALTAIREIAPDTAVIMISGIEDLDVARRTLAHGAFDYVRKPVDFGYLEHSLDTALSVRP